MVVVPEFSFIVKDRLAVDSGIHNITHIRMYQEVDVLDVYGNLYFRGYLVGLVFDDSPRVVVCEDSVPSELSIYHNIFLEDHVLDFFDFFGPVFVVARAGLVEVDKNYFESQKKNYLRENYFEDDDYIE